MAAKNIYLPLPPEVKKLSQRLGLEEGIGNDPSFMGEFVGDRLPKKEVIEEFKHKEYNLYELIESKKPSWKSNDVKKLNYQQKKALFDIKKEKFKYTDFDAINQLWHSYFESVLVETKTNADQVKLSRADYHGALFTVVASKNTTVVGAKGYVLQESKHTFRILNQKNRLLTIPKNGTIFGFEHGGKLYKLNGYNIMLSSYNRSKLKPKYSFILDL